MNTLKYLIMAAFIGGFVGGIYTGFIGLGAWVFNAFPDDVCEAYFGETAEWDEHREKCVIVTILSVTQPEGEHDG